MGLRRSDLLLGTLLLAGMMLPASAAESDRKAEPEPQKALRERLIKLGPGAVRPAPKPKPPPAGPQTADPPPAVRPAPEIAAEVSSRIEALLAKIGVAPDVDDRKLVETLGDEDWQRRSAAFAVLKLRGAKAVEAVGEGFQSQDEEIATRCAELLGQIGRPALALLKRPAANDVESRLRIRARSLIMVIRGRSWMGINIRDLRVEELGEFGLRSSRGVLVTNVIEGTPAHEAGLRLNDFVVEFDGTETPDVAALILTVGSSPADQGCVVRIIRAGKLVALPIALRPMPPLDNLGRPIIQPDPEPQGER